MRTYQEIYDGARDGSPFSNGTEGAAWEWNWCGRCLNDKPAREGRYEDGCQILCVALLGRTPAEWPEQPWGERGPALGDAYHCIEFRDEDDGPGPEPRPQPEDPNQGALWPRADCEGVRMLTPLPERQPATVARAVTG